MKDYNNQGYPKPKPANDKITSYSGIQPASKKGPQPTDMGTTSAKAQTSKFYKGGSK
jgi:hypothetical protein